MSEGSGSKDRNHAAEQENSAANLANLDVDDAPAGGNPSGVRDDGNEDATLDRSRQDRRE